jgi:hypothetical protein
MDGRTAIAVAGIVATAAVGLAAAGLGWVTSRDDRSTQRSLAHDARVYDRKADAYLAALAVIHKQVRQLARDLDKRRLASADGKPLTVNAVPHATPYAMSNDRDATERAAVVAFGSPTIVGLFKRSERNANNMEEKELYLSGLARVMGDKGSGAREWRNFARQVLDELYSARDSWFQLQEEFEARAHSELS